MSAAPTMFAPGPYLMDGDSFVYSLGKTAPDRRHPDGEPVNRIWFSVNGGFDSDGKLVPQEEIAATAKLLRASPEMHAVLSDLVNWSTGSLGSAAAYEKLSVVVDAAIAALLLARDGRPGQDENLHVCEACDSELPDDEIGRPPVESGGTGGYFCLDADKCAERHERAKNEKAETRRELAQDVAEERKTEEAIDRERGIQ